MDLIRKAAEEAALAEQRALTKLAVVAGPDRARELLPEVARRAELFAERMNRRRTTTNYPLPRVAALESIVRDVAWGWL